MHVYPNMVQLSEYALLARSNRLSLMGVRRSRRIGQDHDFERLRDYTVDDNYKHIDWRATARRNKLTVKEYQTSQSQRIVFLLDCGRMMNTMSAGLSLLDHALNAMLMLGYVALRQGDSVGLVCFSDRIHKSVPARGGMSQMNHLLHASFDRFPQLVESRYDLAFLHLATRFRKRALVVLVSNLIDEVNSFQVKRYLQAQVGRHLPLCVLLRDRQLFEAAEPASLAGREPVPSGGRRRDPELASGSAQRPATPGRAGAGCVSRRTDRSPGQSLPGHQGPPPAVTAVPAAHQTSRRSTRTPSRTCTVTESAWRSTSS